MSDDRAAYRVLIRRLSGVAAERGQPLSGTFELTSRCNLSCRMCYIREDAQDSGCRARELPAADWVRLAREARDQGTAFLLLTGGEVLLRPDFFDIWEPLSRIGLMLTLFTNGTLLTEAVADRLGQAPPSRTEITLYGATEACYEAVTGVPGSFRRCFEGVERMVARGLPLRLKCALSRQNVGELEAMRGLAHGYGVPFGAAWLLSPRTDGAESAVRDCRLAVSDCVDIEVADRERRGLPAVARGSAERRNFYCTAGRASYVVDSQGAMHACIDLRRPGAQPLVDGFAAAWAQVRGVVDECPAIDPRCSACEALAYCPRCPAWSHLETGTLNEPVPYLCDLAFERRARYTAGV